MSFGPASTKKSMATAALLAIDSIQTGAPGNGAFFLARHTRTAPTGGSVLALRARQSGPEGRSGGSNQVVLRRLS